MSANIPVIASRYTADGSQFITETARVRGAAEGLNNTSLGRIDNGFASLATTVGKFIPILSAASFANFALSAVRAADAMGDAAERANISVESFSRLQYVAQQSDVEFGSLVTSLRKYQVGLADAARGGGPLLDTLGRLNLSARQLAEMSVEDQLGVIADRFRDSVPAIDRARVATDLFGKSGTELIPLLNRGSAGIRELTDEADRLGITMSGRTVQGIDRASKALSSFWSTTKSILAGGVGNAVAGIFGSGDELLDLQHKYDSLTARLKFFEASARIGGPTSTAAQKIRDIQAAIDEITPRLGLLRELEALESGRGSRSSGPLTRRADPVQEVNITAKRIGEEEEYDRILREITQRRTDDQLEAANTLAARMSEIQAKTLEEQADIAKAVGTTTTAQLEQSLAASQRVREYEREQEEKFQDDLLSIRAAGYAAAQSLQTAYGGKYAQFAKGILIIEKAMAVRSIFMDTQKAMMKAIGQYGAPWGYALAAGIAVYGAARVAAVASSVVGGDNGPAIGAPHNPVSTTPVSPDEPAATNTDQGGQRVVQLIVHGNVYSGKESAKFLAEQISDLINEYDTVIIQPNSRQWDELKGTMSA